MLCCSCEDSQTVPKLPPDLIVSLLYFMYNNWITVFAYQSVSLSRNYLWFKGRIESTIFGLQSQIDVHLFMFPSNIHKRDTGNLISLELASVLWRKSKELKIKSFVLRYSICYLLSGVANQSWIHSAALEREAEKVQFGIHFVREW